MGWIEILKYFSIVALILVASSSFAAEVRVVDRDTIDVNGTRYRLHGIDAPEAGQTCNNGNGGKWPCGIEAIKKMEDLVAGHTVMCDGKGGDAYGRVLGICSADGHEINSAMVASGLAWAFVKYSDDYVAVERQAHAEGIGIWRADTETAWDFRAQKWKSAVAGPEPGKCPIKGNINKRDERIYHTPWSRDYVKTKINEKKGERWFCSEDEAISAGWRAPLWGH